LARITFAWELGGAYGHLGHMLPVARELRARGHDISFVIRELTEAERLLGPEGWRWYQAPLWMGRVLGLPDLVSHAEMLMRYGFLNPTALVGVCRAWHNLYELLAPDLVVFDYAPTALLAARGQPFAQAQMATGFYVPPRAQPMPPFRWWQAVPGTRLLDSQRQVESVVNQVLHALGQPLVGSLHDVLAPAPPIFISLPELDHYAARDARQDTGEWLGPIFSLGRGEATAWPAQGTRRVFAYLKPDYGALEPLLDALNALADTSLVVHIPGVSQRTLQRYSNAHLRITAQPVDIEQARLECDWAVLHAGLATTTAMLLAGKPVLLLPQHLEQTMFARAVERTGAGVLLPEASAGQFPRLIKRALADTTLPAAAQAFAARHAGYDQAETVRTIANRCEALLADRAARSA
jgi:UDP:flavonoid glycosyltransferase YjiC (YdhE family)